MKITQGAKLNDLGYKYFFTNTPEEEHVIPMAFARHIARGSANVSDPKATSDIAAGFFSGALHFGEKITPDKNKLFYDIDMRQAYPTYLLNYSRGKFNYKVGGNKRYYEGVSFFNRKVEGFKVYKIRFVAQVNDLYTSKLYRKWLLKTTKVKDLVMTNDMISGIINIPNIEDMVNRFLRDVQGYERHKVEIDSMVVATGKPHVYINAKNIEKAMRTRMIKGNPDAAAFKTMLNSSTGYIAISDKVLYFAMVNQVKLQLFKLMDEIERWNFERPDLPISIAASNTDGITVYAQPEAELIIKSIIEHRLNAFSPFKFQIKDKYYHEEAHYTANDIRKDGTITWHEREERQTLRHSGNPYRI